MINIVTYIKSVYINNFRISVLNCSLFNDGIAITVSDISKLFDIPVKRINELINNNILMFKNNGNIFDMKSLDSTQFLVDNNILNRAQIGNSKKLYILNSVGFALLMNSMEHTSHDLINLVLTEIYEQQDHLVIEPFKRKENVFFSLLIPIVKELNLSIETQKHISGYYIDAYISDLNLAIEYDESNHIHYDVNKDINRQSIIEKQLGCKFVRVTDEYDVSIALAKTIKAIIYLL